MNSHHAVAFMVMAMIVASVGSGLDAAETNVFLTEGSSCYAAPSTQSYYFPPQSKCQACPTNAFSVSSAYIQTTMTPVSRSVLDAVLARASGSGGTPTTCMCENAKGYANSFPETYTSTNVSTLYSDVPGTTISKPSGIPLSNSSFDLKCVSCAATNTVPSMVVSANGNQGCVPCGGIADVLRSMNYDTSSLSSNAELQSLFVSGTNTSASLTATSVFSASIPGVCQCPTGYVVSEKLGSRRLPVQICVACPNGARDARDPSVCTPCEFPKALSSTGYGCVCASGYEALPSGGCEQTTRLSSLYSGVPSATTLSPPNIGNSGTAGAAVQSALLSQNLASAATACQSTQNATACNLLANLCVLAHYDLESAACIMYRKIQAEESCNGRLSCERPQRLPWLYYIRDSPSIFDDKTFIKTVDLSERLTFVISRFSWDGKWLGWEPVVTQLQQCQLSSQDALDFFAVGSQRKVSCILNIAHFLTADPTEFFELYIQQDDKTLFPVPVLMDYSAGNINPTGTQDSSIFRGGATSSGGSLKPAENSYRRRFFMYDNIGGRSEAIGSSSTSYPAYLTFAKNIRLLVEIRPDHTSQIDVPILLLQYASWNTADMVRSLAESKDLGPLHNLKALKYTKLLASEVANTMTIYASSMFTKSNDTMNRALLITTIIACVLCFISAIARTYGWMRRQQDLMLGMEALMRFVIYYMNHLANVFFIINVLTCAFVYAFFRNQSAVDYMLPTESAYVFGTLYAAVVFKGIYCMFRIHEQCNADIFVIDWERSKGQLLRESKEVPISMWRSTFLANELNEMQTLRGWRPLFSMLLILLFLEGLQYMDLLSTSVPDVPSIPSVTASTNNFLRLAVGAFFWIVITVGLWVLEYVIYYRLFQVHPLKAFADLCSVSNISITILLEPQWGFYIHGESVHQHSDVSMVEFQENLKKEAQGNMPTRGLGGQDHCQTFEVFIGTYMRQYLYLCYADLEMEYHRALHGEAGPVEAGKHRKCFDFLLGRAGKTRTFTDETLLIKGRLNEAFMQSVSNAENSLMNKFGMHSLLDFPPNILFLNGAFAGENTGKDIYFLDEYDHWGRFLLYGMDMELVVLYMLLFFAVDTSLHNSFVAMVVVYLLDLVFVWYRAKEGEANIGAKTLFDERFFL